MRKHVSSIVAYAVICTLQAHAMEQKNYKIKELYESVAKEIGNHLIDAIPGSDAVTRNFDIMAMSESGKHVAWAQREMLTNRPDQVMIKSMPKKLYYEGSVAAYDEPRHLFFDKDDKLCVLVHSSENLPESQFLHDDKKNIDLIVINIPARATEYRSPLTKLCGLRGRIGAFRFEPTLRNLALSLLMPGSFKPKIVIVNLDKLIKLDERALQQEIEPQCDKIDTILFSKDGAICALQSPQPSRIHIWQSSGAKNNFIQKSPLKFQYSNDLSNKENIRSMVFDISKDRLFTLSDYDGQNISSTQHTSPIPFYFKVWDPTIRNDEGKPLFTVESSMELGSRCQEKQVIVKLPGTMILHVTYTYTNKLEVAVWDYFEEKKVASQSITWSRELLVERIKADSLGRIYLCLHDGTILICDFSGMVEVKK